MFSLEKKLSAAGRLFYSVVLVAALSSTLSAAGIKPDEPISSTDNIKKVQESLRDKGYYSGSVDGVLGPKTRTALREYQKSEKLEPTGHLDAQTAGKLGVGPESAGGSFKGAAKEVKEGTLEAGHEMKEGKPVAAGKEMGKGVGRMGKKVGKGVKKTVDPDSDRGDREEKEKK